MCKSFSTRTTLYHSLVVDLPQGIRTDSNNARLIPRNKKYVKLILREIDFTKFPLCVDESSLSCTT